MNLLTASWVSHPKCRSNNLETNCRCPYYAIKFSLTTKILNSFKVVKSFGIKGAVSYSVSYHGVTHRSVSQRLRLPFWTKRIFGPLPTWWIASRPCLRIKQWQSLSPSPSNTFLSNNPHLKQRTIGHLSEFTDRWLDEQVKFVYCCNWKHTPTRSENDSFLLLRFTQMPDTCLFQVPATITKASH